MGVAAQTLWRYNSSQRDFPAYLVFTWERVSSLLQPRWQRASVIKGTKRLGSESAFGIVLLLCEAGQATNKGEVDPSLKVRGS